MRRQNRTVHRQPAVAPFGTGTICSLLAFNVFGCAFQPSALEEWQCSTADCSSRDSDAAVFDTADTDTGSDSFDSDSLDSDTCDGDTACGFEEQATDDPPGDPISGQRVATGGHHSCAITTEGGVKCWGANSRGQLGDGTTTRRHAAVDVVGLGSEVVAITAGSSFTCALTNAGAVMCWGYNSFGRLGDGTTEDRLTPVNVVGLSSGVAKISSGVAHTCVITESGGAKCWGYNYHGQLGDGSTTDQLTPADVVGLGSGVVAISAQNFTCAVTDAGAVHCWGNLPFDLPTTSTPSPIEGFSPDVTTVSGGSNHACGLTTAGKVLCFGDNFYGERGVPSQASSSTAEDVIGLNFDVRAIRAGGHFTCALTIMDDVKCWGDNTDGHLGDGTTTSSNAPVDVLLGVPAVDLWSSHYHSCALTNVGGVRCWGDNGFGQLGNGTADDSSTPVGVIGF